MPKITAACIALTALIVTALTGCSGTTDDAGETSAPPATSTVSETPEPLTAETSEPNAADDADAVFLEYVRENLLPETQIPNATDEQLITAGHDACEQLESGVSAEDIRVVEGEMAHETTGYFYDSIAIRDGAILAYCPA